LERTVTRFEKSADAMGLKFEQTSTKFELRVTRFDAALEAVVVSLEALAVRVGDVKADPGLVESALRPALDAIQDAAMELASALAKETTRFEDATKSIDQLN